jgi:hypothetical protein
VLKAEWRRMHFLSIDERVFEQDTQQSCNKPSLKGGDLIRVDAQLLARLKPL